jgi:hypothetical protein
MIFVLNLALIEVIDRILLSLSHTLHLLSTYLLELYLATRSGCHLRLAHGCCATQRFLPLRFSSSLPPPPVLARVSSSRHPYICTPSWVIINTKINIAAHYFPTLSTPYKDLNCPQEKKSWITCLFQVSILVLKIIQQPFEVLIMRKLFCLMICCLMAFLLFHLISNMVTPSIHLVYELYFEACYVLCSSTTMTNWFI